LIKSQLDFSSIGKDLVFDFSGIVFISRSFAHEFLQFIKSENLNIQFSNTTANVEAMFKAVKHSATSPRKTFNEIPVISFKSKTELDAFFATI
jgi:hypothetical protein